MIKNTENNNGKVVVLFEVTPTAEGKVRYLELAAQLKLLLSDAKGFIRSERFSSLNEEGKLLSLNVWENEEAVEKWRNELHHRTSQSEGRERLLKITGTPSVPALGNFTVPIRIEPPPVPMNISTNKKPVP